MNDDLAAELRAGQAAILAEVRELRRELAERRPQGRLSRENRATLIALVPAIAGGRGSENFYVNELIEDPVIRALLPPGMTAAQLGRLLLRAVDPIGGLRVERVGLERGRVVLWRVVAVPMPG